MFLVAMSIIKIHRSKRCLCLIIFIAVLVCTLRLIHVCKASIFNTRTSFRTSMVFLCTIICLYRIDLTFFQICINNRAWAFESTSYMLWSAILNCLDISSFSRQHRFEIIPYLLFIVFSDWCKPYLVACVVYTVDWIQWGIWLGGTFAFKSLILDFLTVFN